METNTKTRQKTRIIGRHVPECWAVEDARKRNGAPWNIHNAVRQAVLVATVPESMEVINPQFMENGGPLQMCLVIPCANVQCGCVKLVALWAIAEIDLANETPGNHTRPEDLQKAALKDLWGRLNLKAGQWLTTNAGSLVLELSWSVFAGLLVALVATAICWFSWGWWSLLSWPLAALVFFLIDRRNTQN